MKLDQNKEIKRLVIYFFYDGDGIVDRYVPYMLEDVKKNCTDLLVVCNGKLTNEGRQTFNAITPNLIVRENKGFDVWAYKAGLDHYGWERLSEFDEIVMMNHTIMGPLYPFSEMFAEMNERDVDFWGINKHHKHPANPFNIVYGYIPEHIQSHFIAVRKSMITSPEYQKYWNERPEINGYEDAIGKHEAIFTKYFSDMGYVWDVYVDTSDMEAFSAYPLLDDPVRILAEKKCPIFKRRSFFHTYEYFLSNSMGDQGKKLLSYLQNETNYDMGMVWENILRTNHMIDIKTCLDLNYILPKEFAKKEPEQKKIALVIHSYFEDLIDYCYNYALSMPAYSDIYITVGSEKMKNLVEQKFLNGPWNSVTVILIENRGRDVSALLVGAAPYIHDYEYVCFVHDKKVTQLDEGIKGYSFSERCFQNTLGSQAFVNNILTLFEEEPYLGMLCPPPPNHSDYYPTLGLEWGPNYEGTEKLAKELKISCPISREKEPVAPLGTMFWFRGESLKPLLARGWKYEDFPQEPNGIDGTFLHAIERIYPFVVQNSGYYCAWLMNDDYAKTEWTNLSFMLRSLNTKLFTRYGCATYYVISKRVEEEKAFSLQSVKQWIYRRTPEWLWNFMKKIYHLFRG